MVRRQRSVRRMVSLYAGPAVLGLAWVGAAGGAGLLTWMQQTGGTTTALAVTRSHALRAPESGWVIEVLARPGQHVEAGATLARLEVPGMSQELAAAEAEVRGAEEALLMDTADRGLKFARDVESARRALLDAQVMLAGDRAALQQAQSDLDRVTAPDVDQSVGYVTRRQQTAQGLMETLAAREREVSALETAFSEARARSHATFKGEAQLAVAVAHRDALIARMSSGELKAPTAGVIGPLVPAAGEWTTAGSPLLTVTEPVSNEVVTYVAVPFSRGLRVGAAVHLMPDGGTPVAGTIAEIGPAVEPVPAALHPTAATWAMPVHIVTEAMLVPGETVGVDL